MNKSMQIALEKQHSTGINKQFPHLKAKNFAVTDIRCLSSSNYTSSST